jgi:hypothetical protein
MVNNNLSGSLDWHAPLFTKYSIKLSGDGEEYIVSKYDDDGRKIQLQGAEKDEVLTGRALAGSIGYSIDKNHSGWLHALLYVAQVIHEFVTGRRRRDDQGQWNKSYASSCHGTIIVGEALDKDGNPLAPPSHLRGKACHPLMTVDPVFPGVLRYAHDYLRYFDTTKFNVYVPRDQDVRTLIKEHAIRSSFPKKSSLDAERSLHEWKFYTEGCLTDASSKIDFSFKRLLKCLFYNNSKKLVMNIPSERVLETTSFMLADMMLEGPAHLKDSQDAKRSFFCCSYVTTMLQSALFMRSIKHLPDDVKARYITNAQGQLMDRCDLKDKIKAALKGNDQDNAVSNAFRMIFANEKFARADGEFFSSGRFVELADKRSRTKHTINQSPTSQLQGTTTSTSTLKDRSTTRE